MDIFFNDRCCVKLYARNPVHGAHVFCLDSNLQWETHCCHLLFGSHIILFVPGPCNICNNFYSSGKEEQDFKAGVNVFSYVTEGYPLKINRFPDLHILPVSLENRYSVKSLLLIPDLNYRYSARFKGDLRRFFSVNGCD